MEKTSIRKRMAIKTGNFIKQAQAKEGLPVVPKITDEGQPAPAKAPKVPAKAPAAPAPALAPAAPPKSNEEIEADVEKKIEKEKGEEAKVDKMEEKLTSLDEKFDTLIDSFSDMKNILEKGLLGKTEVEEKFNDMKDNKDEDKDVTSDEFGLDEENLVVSNEEEKMVSKAEALRKARKERLTGKKATTLKDEFGLKDKEKTYKPESPAPQITKVKDSEIPSMLKLAELALDLNDAEDTWSVVNKNTNEVHYTIASSDATKEKFASNEFAEAVIADMKKMGIEAALTKYNAKKVEIKADEVVVAPVVEEKKEEKVEEKTEEKQEEAVAKEASENPKDYQRKFLRAFRLALSAQQKNLIDNPLKAAWYDVLNELDVENPTRVIEATFNKGALDQFEVALQKTEEFLNLSDEAFVETASTIGDLATQDKSQDADDMHVEASTSKASEMMERAKKASLVLETSSESDPTDRMQNLQQALPKPKLHGVNRYFSN